MRPLSDSEYAALRGFTCPSCKKKDCIDADAAETFDEVICRDCSCTCCGATWTEEYVLNGYNSLALATPKQKG